MEEQPKSKKVKFWTGKTEVIVDYIGLTDKEIQEEFLSWLVQEADAGFEIIGEQDEKAND